MAASGVEKCSKKKTEKKLAAREEAKLLAGFMGVMNNMRKQVAPPWEWRAAAGRGSGARAPRSLGRPPWVATLLASLCRVGEGPPQTAVEPKRLLACRRCDSRRGRAPGRPLGLAFGVG